MERFIRFLDPNEATHTSEDESSDKTLNLFPIHGDKQGTDASEPVYQYYQFFPQQGVDSVHSSNPTEYGSSYQSTQIGTSHHEYYTGRNKDGPNKGKGHMNIEAIKSNAPKKAKHQHDVTQAQEEADYKESIMKMYQSGKKQGKEFIPKLKLEKYKKSEDSD
uniref:Uncharacterized protein n=1 Tax=Meloidogyne javanica TaxID=6303 RepID=A0A915N9R7_MELJA